MSGLLCYLNNVHIQEKGNLKVLKIEMLNM